MAALIAYLLLRLASLRHSAQTGLQAIARLMPATALTRRPVADLLKPPDPPPIQPHQTQLDIAYA
jgi:hypothetical protein